MDDDEQRDRSVADDVAARLAAIGVAAPPERVTAIGAQLDILDRQVDRVARALAEIARDGRR